jgi:hypothetical protein
MIDGSERCGVSRHVARSEALIMGMTDPPGAEVIDVVEPARSGTAPGSQATIMVGGLPPRLLRPPEGRPHQQ